MRDIRDDLRERIAGLRSERDQLQAQLQAKLQEIATYERNLSALLEMEESRAATEQPRQLQFGTFGTGFGTGPPYSPPEMSVSPKDKLESVILILLQDGTSKSHPELKQRLEEAGFGHEERWFGRVLQGTLMSMRSRELVEITTPGNWRRVMAPK